MSRSWRVLATAVATSAVAAFQLVSAGAASAITPLDCDTVGPTNLIQNCGFQAGTGSPAGWTLSPFSSAFTQVINAPGSSHSGTNVMEFGSQAETDDSISQAVSGTVSGATYELSFWLKSPGGPDFFARVDNTANGSVDALSLSEPTAFAFQEYDVTFTAGLTAPVIVFSGRSDSSYFFLDDVEVVRSFVVNLDALCGSPAPDPQIVHEGDKATSPDESPSADGATFIGWFTDPLVGVQWDFAKADVTKTMTLYARYAGGAPGCGVGGTQTTSAVSTVIPSASQVVFGQPVTFTDTVAPASPIQACTVLQWILGGRQRGDGIPEDGQQYGPDVPVSSATAVGGGLQFALGPLTNLSVGQHHVTAYFPNCPAVGIANTAVQVVKASTSTAVTYADGAATATVSPVAPGAGSPAGSVAFFVDGLPRTTAPLATNGKATAVLSLPSGGLLSAVYSGDDNFTGSSGVRSGAGVVLNPLVVANVRGAHAATSYGWYRSAVTVSFACKAGSAPLAGACPGAVRLATSRAAQSVDRTVAATDGGVTTVTVSPINIDRKAPTLRVKRVGHKLSCHASDALSGVASCTIHRHRRAAHGGTTWVARAVDKAGNVTTKHGHTP